MSVELYLAYLLACSFIPQFVDPTSNYVSQVVLLGLTAMATAAISDGGYAVLAGRARTMMSKRRVRSVPAWRAVPDRRRRLARADAGAVTHPVEAPGGIGDAARGFFEMRCLPWLR